MTERAIPLVHDPESLIVFKDMVSRLDSIWYWTKRAALLFDSVVHNIPIVGPSVRTTAVPLVLDTQPSSIYRRRNSDSIEPPRHRRWEQIL